MDETSKPTEKSSLEYETQLRAANEAVYKHSLELAHIRAQLEEANRGQEALLHFISHEVKSRFAVAEVALSAIVSGDYGEVPPEQKGLATRTLKEMKDAIDLVSNILHSNDFKEGTIKFTMKAIDLKQIIEEEVKKLLPDAQEKKLSLEFSAEPSASYTVNGDATYIAKHVVHNLIDNAIHYTLAGQIKVSLVKKGSMVQLAVADSGVGVTQEDKKKLFTEGGHGKDSIKINTHSTGYGLFIAKSIVEAHKGRIWVESEGDAKGSTFYVEFPAL